MAENKKSFILYRDILPMVSKLPDESAGKLFKHILKYVNDEDPDEPEDILVAVCFEPIKQQLKRDLEKYRKIVERNRANGKNGGRPKSKDNPVGYSGNPSKPQKADNDNDTDTDTDTDTKSKDIRAKKVKLFAPPSLSQINDYLNLRGAGQIDGQCFIDHHQARGWIMSNKQKMKDWKAALRTWISNDKKFNTGSNNGQREKSNQAERTFDAISKLPDD